MYQHAGEQGIYDRVGRVEYAARKMLLTVLGGAITTVGAGVFMFACQITFFNKMATLIVGTIILSFIYSTGFFLSALRVMGPEGHTGDLRLLIKTTMHKFRNIGADKVETKYGTENQIETEMVGEIESS